MQIALIVDDFHDGAGNVAQILATSLSKEHDVAMVLTNLHSKPRYNLSTIDVHSLNLSVSGKNKVFGLVKSIKKLGKLLNKEIKADLIISFIDNNNTLACFSQFFNNVPIIVSERSNPLVIIPKKPWDLLRRIAYKRANVVTVQFEAFKGFDGGRFVKKTYVTPNMVDKPKFVKTDYDSKKVKFVTFGRLAGIKRMDLMIELFDWAQKEYPNMELHIYGEGTEGAKLKDLIEQKHLREKVFLHGYCNDVHRILCDHDVYLMTSRQEGFPNSLSEAMAVGLPSVSFACHDGIVELVENGKSGFFADEGDTASFIEKMVLLAQNPTVRKEMGLAAQRICARYNADEVVDIWKKCIETALNT